MHTTYIGTGLARNERNNMGGSKMIRGQKCALFALSAVLFACDGEGAGDDAISRIDELGNVDAGTSSGESKDGKHKDWEALLACVEPRLKDCADGQIAAIVTAANKGEVTLSKALRPKLTSPAAQKLADQLIEEHTKAQAELEALLASAGIAPIENLNSAHLTEMNELTLASLQKKAADVLDDHFVAHQLATHAQVIGTLDHTLLPSAKHPELKAYLQKVRKNVGGHTETIAKTQGELAGPCGGDLESDGGTPHAPSDGDAGVAPPSGPVVLDAGRTVL